MALLESISVPLGTVMPGFELPAPDGTLHTRDDLMGDKGLLVVFTCNHCPYAQAVWPRLIRLAAHARRLGVNTVAINPNIHPDYPADAPDKMTEAIAELGIDFPYLYDETQNTARAYKAQCTPDLYLLDTSGRLVYHGRIDDNWKDEAAVTRHELREAIEALAAGRPIEARQMPSMGCSIKWRES
ncbi:MAG: thioredoxin family protein [Candidatus Sumerlaeia bacterium]